MALRTIWRQILLIPHPCSFVEEQSGSHFSFKNKHYRNCIRSLVVMWQHNTLSFYCRVWWSNWPKTILAKFHKRSSFADDLWFRIKWRLLRWVRAKKGEKEAKANPEEQWKLTLRGDISRDFREISTPTEKRCSRRYKISQAKNTRGLQTWGHVELHTFDASFDLCHKVSAVSCRVSQHSWLCINHLAKDLIDRSLLQKTLPTCLIMIPVPKNSTTLLLVFKRLEQQYQQYLESCFQQNSIQSLPCYQTIWQYTDLGVRVQKVWQHGWKNYFEPWKQSNFGFDLISKSPELIKIISQLWKEHTPITHFLSDTEAWCLDKW